jgi:ankyrin repeat protein
MNIDEINRERDHHSDGEGTVVKRPVKTPPLVLPVLTTSATTTTSTLPMTNPNASDQSSHKTTDEKNQDSHFSTKSPVSPSAATDTCMVANDQGTKKQRVQEDNDVANSCVAKKLRIDQTFTTSPGHPQSIRRPFAPSIEAYLHQTVDDKDTPTTTTTALKYLPRPEWCKSVNCLMRSRLNQVQNKCYFQLSSIVMMEMRNYWYTLYDCAHSFQYLDDHSDEEYARRRMKLRSIKREMNSYKSNNNDDDEKEKGDMIVEGNSRNNVFARNKNVVDDVCNLNSSYTPLTLEQQVNFIRWHLQSYAIYFDSCNYTWKSKDIDPSIGDGENATSTVRVAAAAAAEDDDVGTYEMTYDAILQQRDINHRFHQDVHHTVLHMAIENDLTDVALDIIRIEYNTYRNGVRRDHDNCMKFYGVLMTTLECVNRNGMTPLILAGQRGNVPVVQALLRCGVEVLYTEPNSCTGPVMLQAAHYGRNEVLDCIIDFVNLNGRDLDCLQLVESSNYKGTTPLMRAAQEGHLSTVQLLLTHQANVNIQNNVGITALMLAVQRGHVDICQLLIDHGANVNLQSERKSTALLIACKLGYVAMVKLLLIAGCNLDLLDRANLTARRVIQTRMRRREAASAAELQVHPFQPQFQDRDSLEESDDWVSEEHRGDYRHTSIRTDAAILRMLNPSAQFSLIQHSMRQRLSYEMIRMHTLVDQNRANVRITDGDAYDATNIVQWLEKGEINSTDSSADCTEILSRPQACLLHSEDVQILLRTMLLPAPLVKLIALYIPLPILWKQETAQLKEYTDPSETIFVACCCQHQ